jgi:hypothetical protein
VPTFLSTAMVIGASSSLLNFVSARYLIFRPSFATLQSFYSSAMQDLQSHNLVLDAAPTCTSSTS